MKEGVLADPKLAYQGNLSKPGRQGRIEGVYCQSGNLGKETKVLKIFGAVTVLARSLRSIAPH